ncbi:MAG: FAD-dependent oxidoreductase [Pseudomonadota bacterium]|nr:FAD-dependent oxidoreductase [Pseudomonadota bacterium]
MNYDYDAIIVGAGVIGAATAFELSKMGWRTINIDRHPTSGYGSTAASCAIIRVHYSTFDGCALAFEGYHYWKDWKSHLEVVDERGLAKFIECGCMIYQTKFNDHLKNVIKRADELSIPYEIWGPEKIREQLPIVDIGKFGPVKLPSADDFGEKTKGSLKGSVYFPTAGYINDPQLSAHNLQRATENYGGRFSFNKSVEKIIIENGRASGVILSDGCSISSRVVINVAGPHSMKVNAMAGVESLSNIKTRALKVEVSHVEAPEAFDYQNEGFVISDSDIGCYSRPETGNNILIGSEDPECDERIFVDPDSWNENFTEQCKTQVLRQAQRYPKLPITSKVKGVVSLYDVSDDWIPIYDKSDLPGFYMAIGTSGNQYKNAPVAGVIMANLIEACENGHEHDTDPVQLKLKYIGRTINLGFYSRNRKINRESSMSVLG